MKLIGLFQINQKTCHVFDHLLVYTVRIIFQHFKSYNYENCESNLYGTTIIC
ncbi:hypothetical protein D3C80_535800 [compost metagenome]